MNFVITKYKLIEQQCLISLNQNKNSLEATHTLDKCYFVFWDITTERRKLYYCLSKHLWKQISSYRR